MVKLQKFQNPEFDKDFDRIVESVKEEILPKDYEIAAGTKARKELEQRVMKVLREYLETYPGLKYRFLGSFPRNTWISGNLEIDLFILFPEETSEGDLERIGLEIGKRVLDEWEERFASHPYVHGRVMGVEVDVVPCYELKSAEKIKSAVDRTPFHHDWVVERIEGKQDDVRLLKAFLRASDIYGAEYKVRGFSGYLCELLVIHYGNFKNLVKNACHWRRGLVIDVAGGREYLDEGVEALFVVDPVDSKRNVAANLSLDSMARFVEKCRDFYLRPDKSFFFKKELEVIPDLKHELKRRSSHILAVVFEKPDIVEDNLYTQLERAKNRLFEYLRSNDFMPLNAGYFVSQDRCILLFETQVSEISKIKKVVGPPFEEWVHVRKFKERNRPYEPFIENGRYYVFDWRKFVSPAEAIRAYIEHSPRALGKNISNAIANYELVEGEDLVDLKIPGFAGFLVDFFKLKRN